MQVYEEDLPAIHKKLIRGKDKNGIFIKQKEFVVDIKPKRNTASNLAGTSSSDLTLQPVHVYNEVNQDVWYLISRHIPPESVQTFALICRQTANIVNTKGFWKHLYKTYCRENKKSILWISKLPENLQYYNIEKHDFSMLRTSVIHSLFICYPNFAKHLDKYEPDILLGRSWLCSWYRHGYNCGSVVSFKFAYCPRSSSASVKDFNSFYFETNACDVVDDWETLAGTGKRSLGDKSDMQSYKGTCYLVISAKGFMPLPPELRNVEELCWRVSATRRLLTSDLRGHNLEIDLDHIRNKTRVTLKYFDITKYKLIPWWHPGFADCEYRCDKEDAL